MNQRWGNETPQVIGKGTSHHEHADIVLQCPTQESFFAHETGAFDYIPTEVK